MIRTTTPVYVKDNDINNPYRLTPYVADNGEIWLAAEGNGCADDIMLEDIVGWTADDINERWGDIDLNALRADADEIDAAGDADTADYIRDWANACERARNDDMKA